MHIFSVVSQQYNPPDGFTVLDCDQPGTVMSSGGVHSLHPSASQNRFPLRRGRGTRSPTFGILVNLGLSNFGLHLCVSSSTHKRWNTPGNYASTHRSLKLLYVHRSWIIPLHYLHVSLWTTNIHHFLTLLVPGGPHGAPNMAATGHGVGGRWGTFRPHRTDGILHRARGALCAMAAMVVPACHVSVVSETAPNIFGGFHKWGYPKMDYIVENPINILLKWMNMDDLGVPPILGNLRMEKIWENEYRCKVWAKVPMVNGQLFSWRWFETSLDSWNPVLHDNHRQSKPASAPFNGMELRCLSRLLKVWSTFTLRSDFAGGWDFWNGSRAIVPRKSLPHRTLFIAIWSPRTYLWILGGFGAV